MYCKPLSTPSMQVSQYHVLSTLLVEKSSLGIKYMLSCMTLVLQMQLKDSVLRFSVMSLLSLDLPDVCVVAVF